MHRVKILNIKLVIIFVFKAPFIHGSIIYSWLHILLNCLNNYSPESLNAQIFFQLKKYLCKFLAFYVSFDLLPKFRPTVNKFLPDFRGLLKGTKNLFESNCATNLLKGGQNYAHKKGRFFLEISF